MMRECKSTVSHGLLVTRSLFPLKTHCESITQNTLARKAQYALLYGTSHGSGDVEVTRMSD